MLLSHLIKSYLAVECRPHFIFRFCAELKLSAVDNSHKLVFLQHLEESSLAYRKISYAAPPSRRHNKRIVVYAAKSKRKLWETEGQMAFINAGGAVSSRTPFVDVFRNKLLQLQRGGRIASHIELEIEGREEARPRAGTACLGAHQTGQGSDGTGEWHNHTPWPWLTWQVPQASSPCPWEHGWLAHWRHLLLHIQASPLVFKQAPGYLSGSDCTDRHPGNQLDWWSSLLINFKCTARPMPCSLSTAYGWHTGGIVPSKQQSWDCSVSHFLHPTQSASSVTGGFSAINFIYHPTSYNP